MQLTGLSAGSTCPRARTCTGATRRTAVSPPWDRGRYRRRSTLSDSERCTPPSNRWTPCPLGATVYSFRYAVYLCCCCCCCCLLVGAGDGRAVDSRTPDARVCAELRVVAGRTQEVQHRSGHIPVPRGRGAL